MSLFPPELPLAMEQNGMGAERRETKENRKSVVEREEKEGRGSSLNSWSLETPCPRAGLLALSLSLQG